MSKMLAFFLSPPRPLQPTHIYSNAEDIEYNADHPQRKLRLMPFQIPLPPGKAFRLRATPRGMHVEIVEAANQEEPK